MFQSIRGMRDVFAEEGQHWQAILQEIERWTHAFSYQWMMSPVLEPADLFLRSLGDETDVVQKEMYVFTDQLNRQMLALRPEGTAGCVRALIESGLDRTGGEQRFWYMGPMFRHERPQKGRYRQFHQVGVEAFGLTGINIEVELILMGQDLWRRLCMDESVALHINSIGSAEDRQHYRDALKEYFLRYASDLSEEVRLKVERNPLRLLDSKDPFIQSMACDAPSMTSFLSSDSQHLFDSLCGRLSDLGLSYSRHPELVRGLDYYNGVVFEWVHTGLEAAQSTICGGGRYDGLVSLLGGHPVPACGFAIGLDRLLLACGRQTRYRICDVFIAYNTDCGTQAVLRAYDVAAILRAIGFSVRVQCTEQRFAKQLKKAHALGAHVVVLIGEEELSGNVVSVKFMENGEQKRISLGEDFLSAFSSLHAVLTSDSGKD